MNIKEWYLGLAQREQHLTLAAGAVIIIGLVFQLVVSPIHAKSTKAEANLQKKQDLLIWVNENAAKIRSLKASGKGRVSGALSQIVPNSARKSGIVLSSTKLQGEEFVISIDNVNFNTLLNWLENLTLRNGLIITVLDIAPSKSSGNVKVKRLQLAK